MNKVEKHFDAIAPDYDYWKKKNWYFYDTVKKVYGGLIPAGSRVLEVGCGTGEILASLNPAYGVGIDVSGEMVRRALQKYASIGSLKFFHADAKSFVTEDTFDYIFLRSER